MLNNNYSDQFNCLILICTNLLHVFCCGFMEVFCIHGHISTFGYRRNINKMFRGFFILHLLFVSTYQSKCNFASFTFMITLVMSKDLNTSQVDFKFKGKAAANIRRIMLSSFKMVILKRNYSFEFSSHCLAQLVPYICICIS